MREKPCHTYGRVIWIGHVTHVNESCHAYAFVKIQIHPYWPHDSPDPWLIQHDSWLTQHVAWHVFVKIHTYMHFDNMTHMTHDSFNMTHCSYNMKHDIFLSRYTYMHSDIMTHMTWRTWPMTHSTWLVTYTTWRMACFRQDTHTSILNSRIHDSHDMTHTTWLIHVTGHVTRPIHM